MPCRQKEEARRSEEAARRSREAEGERARQAAYHEALRREADRISAILAKQVGSPPGICLNNSACRASCFTMAGPHSIGQPAVEGRMWHWWHLPGESCVHWTGG